MKKIPRNPQEWYNTSRWITRRNYQLAIEPLCRICLTDGRTTPAAIADHIEPHRGDWNAFMLGALQSLCLHCHISRKREIELRGYRTDIGPDGRPVDPRHPVYAMREP